ncbi:UNVERIFIED_CONTAM: hypothetical protein DVV65_15860, partial [Lactiplantibacillus plantarum]|nr:hypothetical protein [Lactiplantibacillus plantarum]
VNLGFLFLLSAAYFFLRVFLGGGSGTDSAALSIVVSIIGGVRFTALLFFDAGGPGPARLGGLITGA